MVLCRAGLFYKRARMQEIFWGPKQAFNGKKAHFCTKKRAIITIIKKMKEDIFIGISLIILDYYIIILQNYILLSFLPLLCLEREIRVGL